MAKKKFVPKNGFQIYIRNQTNCINCGRFAKNAVVDFAATFLGFIQ